jgi:hypothetical protein
MIYLRAECVFILKNCFPSKSFAAIREVFSELIGGGVFGQRSLQTLSRQKCFFGDFSNKEYVRITQMLGGTETQY